jgi:hypothetical protein
MKARLAAITMVLAASIATSADGLAQATPAPESQPGSMLSVKGYTATTPLVEMNGRSYVDLEALARLIEGSLSYAQNQVTLTLPSAPGEAPSAEANPGFSKPFVKAGIELMADIREWRIAIVDSVRNNYPISADGVSTHRRLAERNLKLATTAASTDDDRSAIPLLTAEFNNMQKLSDRILGMRRRATYIDRRSLDNDPLNQQILTCAQSMAAMVANNAFQDDAHCREARN